MPSGRVFEERKPDYFIGSTGRPVLLTASHFTTASKSTMHRSGSGGRVGSEDAGNSKLSKHLHNLTIRNGSATGANDRHRSINGTPENDITTAIAGGGRRCSKSPPVRSGPTTYEAVGRRSTNTVGSSSRWSTVPLSNWNCSKTGSGSFGGQRGQQQQQSDRSRSVTSPAPRLLSGRSSSIARPGRPTEAPESRSLVLQQHCRYSNQHKQLDNRLSYQRSYDRNIFGYDQPIDQFVLPPLQI